MSWELASFLVLGAVLLGGFAWYERSRPPAQVVALVAALAALAVAGRLAFAAIPNVVATTDIVIIAGYAVGAAPGFAVGALAALISNLWLGQGPWTPWQMAGWGLCGILGAALALGGRRAGRLTLAAACGFAGLAYGALMDFSLMATYGGDLSAQRFFALSARGVPFNVAHAVGNVTLALLAGPAMARMLVRFRERFEWRRGAGRPAAAPGAGIACALLLAVAFAAIGTPHAQASAAPAVHWLRSTQNADGGWSSSPGEDSSVATTAWVMLGLEAAGRNPLEVRRAGRDPVDALRAAAGEIRSSGDLARTILALKGAGVSPRAFAGRDLVAELARKRRRNGSWDGWPGTTAFAVMALRIASARLPLGRSLAWLRKVQNRDGGWGDVPGSPSTPDGTGAVMQAMPRTRAARRGLAYLRRAQRPGGGYALGGFGSVNSQSTAWAVQGMIAVGADPARVRRRGSSPLDYLARRQAADGHYRYSRSSDQTPVWVTGQVLVAASRKTFPIPPVPRRSHPSPNASNARHPPSSTASSASTPEPSSSDAAHARGGVGAPPERFAPSRPGLAGNSAISSSARGRAREGSDAAQSPASAPSDEGSGPWIPLGLGLGLAGLVLGGTWLLGRRYGW